MKKLAGKLNTIPAFEPVAFQPPMEECHFKYNCCSHRLFIRWIQWKAK